ncbi:MAG: hypothetical protein DRJ03_08315 [Chloroflexi bacterium]|nr:MAG: hypothetical protein DRJ03_08315 [Chloroflexota bacterium]
MRLAIALPDDVREQVQDIAIQKDREVESIIITAVLRYIAEEQCAEPSQDIPQALARSQRLYQGFKERLGQRYPSLGNLPREQVAPAMDELAEKVAEGMAFANWREAEAFMRGEGRYDFARQQYLYH